MDYINALVDDAEALIVEEMEDAGRKYRRAARKIAAERAGKAITPELWESRLKGNADEQASIAVQFLDTVRTALLRALSEMRVRR